MCSSVLDIRHFTPPTFPTEIVYKDFVHVHVTDLDLDIKY